jgi:hypothetical protein
MIFAHVAFNDGDRSAPGPALIIASDKQIVIMRRRLPCPAGIPTGIKTAFGSPQKSGASLPQTV